MNLVIDIGNTRAKIAVFKKNKMLSLQTIEKISVAKIRKISLRYPQIQSSIISTVIKPHPDVIKYLKNRHPLFINLNSSISLPIKIKYKTPHTLGNDRIANAVAASCSYPHKNVLVIDAGSCLKFDFTDEKKNYLGGAISPGLNMRYKALHHFTQQLPLIKPARKIPFTGTTTSGSILSGVQNGMFLEIKGMIKYYEATFGNLVVILTGGDAEFFANQVKSSIFAAPNFTLSGLNEILNHNAL